MRVEFDVPGLPPKKNVALSMWSQPAEREKLIGLRIRAAEAFKGRGPLAKNIRLQVICYLPENTKMTGDLDNFVSGICDGLMAASSETPVGAGWTDYPSDVAPSKALGIVDDYQVVEIVAKKVIGEPAHYTVVLEGEN